MEISFSAYEYQQDEVFHKADYRYQGSCEQGWEIFRNDQLLEMLGPGYVLLKSLYCGICSTDIARAKLPFPLPQITGHEVIAFYQDKPVAVEINASHLARGLSGFNCHYCDQGMDAHCPERLTLGIDRLPGGFSPYILAPKNAICPLPGNFNLKQSAVIEPFAAALHAVESSQLTNDMRIGVVGPKRLGLLLIFALMLYRKESKLNFTISAIIRHSELSEMCDLFGADEIVLVDDLENREFDIVYDTSGSVSGFQLAMTIAKSTVHVKSTHGLAVGGFLHLTRLVIDEISLLPLINPDMSDLKSTLLDDENDVILLSSTISRTIKDWVKHNFPDKKIVVCDLSNVGLDELRLKLPTNRFKKFDVALVSSIDQLNKVMDFPDVGCLVRARGDVFWCGSVESSPKLWADFFKNKLEISASRCGDFSKAITLIEKNVTLFSDVISKYISGGYDISDINRAFDVARRDVTSIKLVIKH